MPFFYSGHTESLIKVDLTARLWFSAAESEKLEVPKMNRENDIYGAAFLFKWPKVENFEVNRTSRKHLLRKFFDIKKPIHLSRFIQIGDVTIRTKYQLRTRDRFGLSRKQIWPKILIILINGT